ncbi:hypothetical protein HMPREF9192_0356 [Streptococcus vestibularis F0396]|uniref:Uncharacterized protein n=1 Tax=Streptococcus vestibularis F0396 TaxID=904306 RepID=E3CT74_STRVE|nr:hypothetical protein HMPREF9192_0356 [Streptococcus vestibularis F0396]
MVAFRHAQIVKQKVPHPYKKDNKIDISCSQQLENLYTSYHYFLSTKSNLPIHLNMPK